MDGPDLQLILAVDASESVTNNRFTLQMQGYAAAFRDPAVHRAIGLDGRRRIDIAMFHWTGPEKQAEVFPWQPVDSPAAAILLAERIAASPRLLNWGGTSISGAVLHAMRLFDTAPVRAPRRVLDISGDGQNNAGHPMGPTRDRAVAAGITINGLPILWVEPRLEAHYQDEVIGGRNAFLIAIESFDEFAEAITRKLEREIA